MGEAFRSVQCWLTQCKTLSTQAGVDRGQAFRKKPIRLRPSLDRPPRLFFLDQSFDSYHRLLCKVRGLECNASPSTRLEDFFRDLGVRVTATPEIVALEIAQPGMRVSHVWISVAV